MIKKKHKILIITAAFILTSCTSVPNNIKEREEELDSIPAVQTTTMADADEKPSSTNGSKTNNDNSRNSLEYIRENLKQDVSIKYGTITVKNASVCDAQAMPTYKVQVKGNPNCDHKKIVSAVYGNRFDAGDKSLYKSVEFKEQDKEIRKNPDKNNNDDPDYLPPVYIFSNIDYYEPNPKDATCSTIFHSDGTCWGSQVGQNAAGDDYYAASEGSKKHYYPKYDDISNISYKMKDGTEWKLSDAIDFVEKFWNDELSANDPVKYTYKVWRIDVIPLSNKNYGYFFSLTFFDENSCEYECDTFSNMNMEEDKALKNKRIFEAPSQYAYCIEKNSLTQFTKQYSFVKMEKTNDNDKLLTLGEAMKKLENKLASNINLSFETAELKYILTCDKYPYEHLDGTVMYGTEYCLNTCDIYIRPVWCFRSTNGYNDCWNTTVNYYVDAVTGEVHIIGSGF